MGDKIQIPQLPHLSPSTWEVPRDQLMEEETARSGAHRGGHLHVPWKAKSECRHTTLPLE